MRSPALMAPRIAVDTVKELPVVTAMFDRFASVIPPSPTTEVNAPSPMILAPRPSASLTHFSNLS